MTAKFCLDLLSHSAVDPYNHLLHAGKMFACGTKRLLAMYPEIQVDSGNKGFNLPFSSFLIPAFFLLFGFVLILIGLLVYL